MRIEWAEKHELQQLDGQGVEFYAPDETDASGESRCLIAVVNDMAWVDSQPDVVRVEIRPADAEFDIVFMNEAKGAIGAYIRNPGLMRKGRNPSDVIFADIHR